MTLSKKHFEKIAEILRNVGYDLDRSENIKMLNQNELIYELCLFFKSENSKFDEKKFREAVLK